MYNRQLSKYVFDYQQSKKLLLKKIMPRSDRKKILWERSG